MKQQTSDHLDVLIITYQSEIPERYGFEIVEPIKEDSEIAIALYSIKFNFTLDFSDILESNLSI